MDSTVNYNENGNPIRIKTEHGGQTTIFKVDGGTAVGIRVRPATGESNVYLGEVKLAMEYVADLPFVQGVAMNELEDSGGDSA